MRVLVTGATGFIGGALLARLHKDGFETIAAARPRSEAPRGPAYRWIEVDFADSSETTWRQCLEGVDAVVNCAGVFADSLSDSTKAVHVEGTLALFGAARSAGVRRIVHLSALGVGRALTPFSSTKLEAERALARLDIEWTILRPSIVVGEAAYGGGALLRGLAALPVFPEDPRAAPVQVVQLDDVVSTIVYFLDPKAPTGLILDIVGPSPLSLTQAVGAYRAWLGWPAARVVRTPDWLMRSLYALGDLAGALGWRTPIRTAARRELETGSVGEAALWIAATGIRPKALHDALAERPASLQERRFAQLYFLKPLVFAATAAFWIATGVASLTFGYGAGVDLLREAGMGALSGPGVIAGGLADLLIGIGIAFRPTTRPALWLAIAASLFYAIAGSIALPRLWFDPLGPMLKIWPLIALNIVALAMARDR